jgi:hypothetical protein
MHCPNSVVAAGLEIKTLLSGFRGFSGIGLIMSRLSILERREEADQKLYYAKDYGHAFVLELASRYRIGEVVSFGS